MSKKQSILLFVLVILLLEGTGGQRIIAAGRTMASGSAIRIANPLSDQSYSGHINVQAVTSGVVSVVYQVDTLAVVAMAYQASSQRWQASLDTTKLRDGQHNVTVIGRTQSGATVQDRAWNIRVTNVAPATPTSGSGSASLRIAHPLSNSTYTGRIMVQAVAADMKQIVYQVDTSNPVVMTYNAGSRNWEAPLDTATLTPGLHNVTVIGRNAAGRTAQDRAWNITVTKSGGQPGTPTPLPTSPPPVPSPTATPQDPHIPFLRGVNLAGAEFGDDKLPGKRNVDYTYPSTAELDYFHSKGLNLIRVPFRWERVQHTLYGPLDKAELNELDIVVAGARSRNMRVLLDLHNYGRYRNRLVGSSKVPNSAFADVWRKLAEHYRDEPTVWAYGLMNEPHDTKGLWPVAAQAGIIGIRSVDMKHTILVAGDGWSGAHSWLENNRELNVIDPANNFMYEAHQYFDRDSSGSYQKSYDQSGAYPNVGVDRARPFVEWLKARNARGFFGEYGVPDNDARWQVVLDNFLAYLDTNRIGGTYWAAGPWWGSYPLSVEPRNGKDRPQMNVLVRHPGQQ